MSTMTDEELFDALSGLFAYDTSCVDSGIHDERLRARVKRELERDLEGHPASLAGPRLTRFARRYLEPPYTLEDVASFIKWLADRMEIEL